MPGVTSQLILGRCFTIKNTDWLQKPFFRYRRAMLKALSLNFNRLIPFTWSVFTGRECFHNWNISRFCGFGQLKIQQLFSDSPDQRVATLLIRNHLIKYFYHVKYFCLRYWNIYCLLFSQILRDAGYFLDGDFFSQYYVLWISEIEKYMMKRKQDEDWMIHLLENAQFFREPTKAIGRRFQFGDMKNPSSMR